MNPYSDLERLGSGMTSPRTRDRMVQRLQEQGIRSLQVLEAMRSLPRHLFVDEALAHRAYEDSSLPISQGQTISQPYVVARMSEVVLSAARHERVLEVGTGCGYQTALLAELFQQVYSLERIRPLQDKARERLLRLGYHNCQLRHADGLQGWPEQAPFDAILCAAAPLGVPQLLLDQLAVDGCLVLPVARAHEQELVALYRRAEGVEEVRLGKVHFVPMRAGLRSN